MEGVLTKTPDAAGKLISQEGKLNASETSSKIAAVLAEPVRSPVRPSQAGLPDESSLKGRILHITI